MTHYVAIVVADTEEQVEELLEPYSEHLAVEPHFRPETSLNAMADFYKAEATPEALKPHMKAWVGYPGDIQDGVLGYMSTFNEEALWDWYEIGGRWSDIVPDCRCPASKVKDYFTTSLPSVLIDSEGAHKTKRWGWWGTYSETDTPTTEIEDRLKHHGDKNVFIVDLHI